MKVAVVTVDGKTVSQHFGRSPYYKIYTIKDGDPTDVEMRERGTGHFARQDQPGTTHAHHTETDYDHQHNGRHGYGAEADMKHASMADEISDCQVLVAGGMGQGAYESFKRAGLDVILTDHSDIDAVIRSFSEGNLINLADQRTD